MPRIRNGKITPQIGYYWFDDRFIHQECPTDANGLEHCRIILSDGTPIADTGTTLLLANGLGVFAYIEYTHPVPAEQAIYHDSFGRVRMNTFPSAISPDGVICIHPHSGMSAALLFPDGHEEILTDGIASGVNLFENRKAMWREGWPFESNFPCHAPLVEFYDFVGTSQGDVLYQAVTGELVLNNRVVEPPSDKYFYLGLERVGETLTYAWSPNQADTDGVVRSITLDVLATKPIVLPVRVVTVPKVNRKCWMWWFTWGISDAPGNAWFPLDGNPYIRRRDGPIVAQYVAAEADGTPEGLDRAIREAETREPKIPVIPYWPKGFQEARRLPAGSGPVGVVGYKLAAENHDAWFMRVKSAINLCAPRKVHIIANGYTSNASNETDLAGLVPYFARLIIDCPNVEGIAFFSAGSQDRHSGYESHPEAHKAWADLFAGITGMPDLPTTPTFPVPPVKPKPPVPVPVPVAFIGKLKGVNMDSKLIGLVGPGGKYCRIDPIIKSVVNFDRENVGADEQFEAVKLSDGRFKLRAKHAGVILSADNTIHGSQLIAAQFSTRPDTDDPGNYERWTIKEDPDSGLVLAFIRYTEQGAVNERKFAGGLLSVIVQ